MDAHAPPPPPPRPELSPAGLQIGNELPPDQTLKPWQRALAIWGVANAFLYFFTVPGWIALRRYRQWKRGEAPRPIGLVWWGAIANVLLAGTIALIAAGIAPSATRPSAASPPRSVPPPPASAPTPAAWERYAADDGSFSIRYPSDMPFVECSTS